MTIPNSDTTYWCAGFELPETIQDKERYIIRVILVVICLFVDLVFILLYDKLNKLMIATTDP